MLKQAKIELVENLDKTLQTAHGVILVNYTGLNVKAQQELKKRLNEVSSHMVVVKNTLLKRAAKLAKIDEKVLTDDILSGQTAIIIAEDDAVAPIQVLGKFAKEFELPKFKVGVVDGVFQDSESLSKISTLPSKDALLGQLLGSLISGMYGLVGTLNSPMQQLVYTINQKAKQG